MDADRMLIIGIIISIFLIIGIVFYINISTPKGLSDIEREKLEKVIVEDASQRYPDADIVEIIDRKRINNTYEFKVRVTWNYTSICPIRYHLYYYYPSQHLVPKLPEKILSNCDFCKEGNCIIAFEEEAIQASVNMPECKKVREFVEEKNALPEVKKVGNLWVVKWSSVDESYVVTISEDGKLKGIEKI